jgi:hypothetical protein
MIALASAIEQKQVHINQLECKLAIFRGYPNRPQLGNEMELEYLDDADYFYKRGSLEKQITELHVFLNDVIDKIRTILFNLLETDTLREGRNQHEYSNANLLRALCMCKFV